MNVRNDHVTREKLSTCKRKTVYLNFVRKKDYQDSQDRLLEILEGAILPLAF